MRQIYLIFSILLVFLTSCENDDLPQSDVAYSSVAKGDSFPNDESTAQTHLVIKDTKTWNNLMTKMSAPNNLVKDFKETNIDFNNYQIVAVIDRTQGSGGHSIEITKMAENRNMIIVKVEKLKNGNLSSRLSRPYDIVKIEKTTKKVIFEQ